MRLLVVGAGSTGGYFGGRLAQAGRDVTFLVRPRRADQLRDGGLTILSPLGDVSLRPTVVTTESLAETYDVILLSVKAYSLESALADLAPAVGPKTMIIPMLNGMRHLEMLAERFGPDSVLGGVCVIGATLDDQGRIIHMNELHDFSYGELTGVASARIQAVDQLMQGAGFNARLSPTIERDMWEKWVFLASMGGINCLMRGNIGEIQAAPGGTESTLELLKEVTTVVRAIGVKPTEAFLSQVQALLTTAGSKQASSMYRDLGHGGRIEADQIIGDLLARARRANIATPLLTAVYAQLCVYQSRLGPQAS
jgi:2-dehydropantoate 2-reductase